MRQGKKLDAIKIVREVRLLGLKEAKDVVDAYVEANPEFSSQARGPVEAGTSWLPWLAALMVAALIGYFYFMR